MPKNNIIRVMRIIPKFAAASCAGSVNHNELPHRMIKCEVDTLLFIHYCVVFTTTVVAQITSLTK